MDKIVPEYKMAVLRHILKKVHGKQKQGQLKAQHSVKQLNCFFFPGFLGSGPSSASAPAPCSCAWPLRFLAHSALSRAFGE